MKKGGSRFARERGPSAKKFNLALCENIQISSPSRRFPAERAEIQVLFI